VLTQTKDFTKIKVVNNDAPLSACYELDLLVYIGDKRRHAAVTTATPRKYFGIGNYELYVHEEMDATLIQEAKMRGVTVFESDTDIKTLNRNGDNYCTAIMTRDKNKAREFIGEIQSTFVLVNMIPTLETRINIFPHDLLKRKSVAIYDK
jgi:hypothetical protein